MSRKIDKLNIEDYAKTVLDKDELKNVICFNEFLLENELVAERTSKYFYSVMHEKIRICTIAFYGRILSKNCWWIRFFGRYHGSSEMLHLSEKYLSEELKTLIINNISLPGCKNCNSFESIMIFGKMFDRVCWCTPFRLINLDGKSLEYAKEIVLINKKTAADIATKKTMLERTTEPGSN